jgi:hypothetical protein
MQQILLMCRGLLKGNDLLNFSHSYYFNTFIEINA